MKLATLDLTSELFLEFSKVCMDGGGLSRRLKVKANPLPDDVRIERVGMAHNPPLTLRLYLTSETFAEVPDGIDPPQLPPVVFETIYDGETEQ